MSHFEPTPDPEPARPTCEPARAALQRLLDCEPTWDSPEAARHRSGCSDCREELAVARLVSRALAPPAVPAELTSRLVGSALAARWRRRLARGVGVGVAFAASVAVAVVLLEPKPQTITEAPREVAVAKPARPSAPEMPLGEAVTEAREALVSLTRRTATETRDSSASVIPNPKLPDMSEPGPGLEPLADAQAGAARSVEPIQASARRAINLFLRAADPPSKSAVQ